MIKADDLMRMTNAAVQAARAVREERVTVSDALLEILDGFDDALFAAQRAPNEGEVKQSLDAWIEGFGMFPKRITAILDGMGIHEIPVNPGDPFNPEQMDIFLIEFTEDEEKWGIVEGVYRRGFSHSRSLWPDSPPILRNPKVRVWGAHPEESADQ